MKKNPFALVHLTERFFIGLMLLSLLLVVGSLIGILSTIITRGLPVLTVEMLTHTPEGGYYLGKGGGILNAIIGSLYLAGGATFLSLLIGLPLVIGINVYARRWVTLVRMSLDIMWGVPTIVFGAFGFMIMLWMGARASLFAGILVLTLLELPVVARTIDEFIRMVPPELWQAGLALGATRLEVSTSVILRQILPGLVTAVLLGFGRAIGDAASVLFTAGYTDRIPDSLFSPVASLPLAVFFQLNTPFPEVQQRAYASALVLTILVLLISLGSRWFAYRLGRFVVK